MKSYWVQLWIALAMVPLLPAQSYDFDFNNNGRRVCLAETQVDTDRGEVEIRLLDASDNAQFPTSIYRRPLGVSQPVWETVVLDLPPGTPSYLDRGLPRGQQWEYQLRRRNTWQFRGSSYDAIGYAAAANLVDRTEVQGRMILLVAADVPSAIPEAYAGLKRDLTADGWWVEELVVARASSWDSGAEVLSIRAAIQAIYDQAPADDKPRQLLILGHVPLPRCGAQPIPAPDLHAENRGARGCDAFYADLDGQFTDTLDYDPGNLVDPLLVNRPGDFKWDQDFLPSPVELAFGRVDFADLTDLTADEMSLLGNYLDRLSRYRRVAPGWDMGKRTAFFRGYDNSNDGAFRSLPSISSSAEVVQNYDGGNHPRWVSENGPFQLYLQNQFVPSIEAWRTHGMEATVFTSDQSYWGFGDLPQRQSVYSRIRALLGVESKCLVTWWTTTGLNIFHRAGLGMPLGEALFPIINHAVDRPTLEKPPQDFDSSEWWNRSHFTLYGDPTLRLYQVAPVGDLRIAAGTEAAVLNWSPSPDSNLRGYHVYRSDSEWGPFEKITTTLLTEPQYRDRDYRRGDWYLVKAVALQVTGSGHFFQPSLGQLIQGNFTVGTAAPLAEVELRVYPQPSRTWLTVETPASIRSLSLWTLDGRRVATWPEPPSHPVRLEVAAFPTGIYFLEVQLGEERTYRKIILE